MADYKQLDRMDLRAPPSWTTAAGDYLRRYVRVAITPLGASSTHSAVLVPEPASSKASSRWRTTVGRPWQAIQLASPATPRRSPAQAALPGAGCLLALAFLPGDGSVCIPGPRIPTASADDLASLSPLSPGL